MSKSETNENAKAGASQNPPPAENKGSESKVERWVSRVARNHMVHVLLPETGLDAVVKFKDYAVTFDLSNAGDKALSDALKKSKRAENSVCQVVNKVEGQKQMEMMQYIQNASRPEKEGGDPLKIRALFSTAELAVEKLPSTCTDVVALAELALRTKALKGKI